MMVEYLPNRQSPRRMPQISGRGSGFSFSRLLWGFRLALLPFFLQFGD